MIVIVIGPTGVGKTKLGVELAQRFNGEVISMDSMQVYDELDILTNKVTVDEAKGVPHHLIGEISLEHQFNASEFVKRVDELIAEIESRQKLAILVGGTCYYAFNFLVRRHLLTNHKANSLEREFQNYQCARKLSDSEKRDEELGEILRRVDEKAFLVTRHNPKKYGTYLESYFNTGGMTIDQVNATYSVKHGNALFLWISSDLSVLDKRIETRAESMVTAGLRREIVDLVQRKPKIDFTQTQYASIGLQQLLPLVNGDCSKETERQCIERLKSVTKKYARNQQRYINTKFCAKDRFPGLPTLYQLDATNLASWDENVASRAAQAVADRLAGRQVKLPVASKAETLNTGVDYFAQRVDENTIVDCTACNVKVINAQLSVHLGSKRHKKRAEGLRKRARNEAKRRNLDNDCKN